MPPLDDNNSHASDFQIPGKQSRVIPIVAPAVQVAVPSISPPRVKSNVQRSTTTDNKPTAPSSGRAEQPQRMLSPRMPPQPQSQVSHSTVTSSLDIFSPNYVPLWLRAVNESYATLQPSQPFPGIDYESYIASFVGNDFVRPVLPAPLPPSVPTLVGGSSVTEHNYTSYWLNQLQNEFAQQLTQYNSFALYNQQLHPVPKRPGLYSLSVPGLREDAPRLDLGDTVHVRPLNPSIRYLESHVEQWLRYGRQEGAICPGFGGLLYDPQIWEINRTKEIIVLRIDGFDSSVKCNIVFLLQESKLEPLCRAVHSCFKGGEWMRRMLFPEPTNGNVQFTLSPGHFAIPWKDDLNWEQKKAVHTILTADYGSLPYLVSGPPGTGKTKTLVETAMQLLSKPGHLLICAPSDAAADTLALRLSQHLQPDELFRLNGWNRTFAEVPDRLLVYTHTSNLSFSLPPVDKMLSYRIVVTTCRDADMLNRARLTNVSLSGLFRGVRRLLDRDSMGHPSHWTALLLDEAAQATEPDVLIPLSVVMPPDATQSPQFIAAGDQHQLGPKLISKSKLSVSLFQRLFERVPYEHHPLSRKHGVVAMTASMLPMWRPPFTNLIRNYRSHPAILSVPSLLFYNDTLITERKTSKEVLGWSGWPSTERWPVMFHQNDSGDFYESITDGDGSGSGTLYNPGEAHVALTTVQSLLEELNLENPGCLRQSEIIVMTPFRAQVFHLRNVFRQNKLYEVNIGPLEAFQGLESRVVIICTTRTRLGVAPQPASHHVEIDQSRGLGVLDEPQRLNVAMTRAQEGLIVIGNAPCLTSTGDKQWLCFLDFCKRNKCFKAPTRYVWPDLGSSHAQGRLERALMYAALHRADVERNAKDTEQQSLVTHESRFKLRGHRPNMDEEMWQFGELALANDSEDIDLVFEHNSAEAGSSRDHVEADTNEEAKEVLDNDYDRDFPQEFHQECTAQ